MWLKILLIVFIVTTTTSAAATKDLTKDIISIINNPDRNLSYVTNYINEIMKSLNLSDIKVNIILNPLEEPTEIEFDRRGFENSIKYLFQTVLNSDRQMTYNLQEVARIANNLTVHEVLYEILWQKLKNDRNKRNPFSYIELYENVENVLKNFSSMKLISLHKELERDVIACSAQLLQSYFIQKSTIQNLLKKLKPINNLYEMTIPYVYENLNTIEHQWQISKDLLEFDPDTPEAIFNHITYIQYLQTHNESIPKTIYDNLEILIARSDLENVTLIQRQLYNKILPKSMGNLLAGQKICLRNTTTNFYIYECPQTYLMCTNSVINNTNHINRKKAAYEIKRLGNNQYGLYSPFWGRYLHLQSSSPKNGTSIANPNNNATVAQITKNLYSHAEMTPWLIRFHDDYATIQDAEEIFYICGGDSSYWSNMEKYAYTRPSRDFHIKENECLWMLEDCSDVI